LADEALQKLKTRLALLKHNEQHGAEAMQSSTAVHAGNADGTSEHDQVSSSQDAEMVEEIDLATPSSATLSQSRSRTMSPN
jgi:hypothetical protein